MVICICDVQLGAGDGQALWHTELGAGAVGGPVAALAAGERRDLLGLRVHNTDCVVTSICHIKLGAGDGQALWSIELGVCAGAVGGTIASAGEGRDFLGPGVDNADCVVKFICDVQLDARQSQALWSIELGVGAGGVNQPIDIRIAGEIRDHRIRCWGARAWSWCGSRGWSWG